MNLEIAVRHRLGSVEFDFRCTLEGGIWAVLGPSGAGKTSLLNAIGGFLKPDSGRVTLNGRQLVNRAERIFVDINKRGVGYVFQDLRLFPHMNVLGNLKYAQRLGRDSDRQYPLDQLARELEIDHLLNQPVQNLSGGEKQRVAIARSLLAAPELLMLDEPFRGLDKPRRSELIALLKQVAERLDVSLLVVSHDIRSVRELTDNVVIIQDGKIAAQGRFKKCPMDNATNHDMLIDAEILTKSQGADYDTICHDHRPSRPRRTSWNSFFDRRRLRN